MEYRVLEYLAMRRGALVSKEELLEHLYDYNWEKFGNVIEVYISGLRRKIELVAGEKLIQTVRGLGYALRLESEAVAGAADRIQGTSQAGIDTGQSHICNRRD